VKLKILSIDGGGIRGVIPLQVIKYIEEITSKPIHELFDLIAGTSTGGLLTSALVLKDNKSSIVNKRKYNLDEIESIYTNRSQEIFPFDFHPYLEVSNQINSFFKPRYNPSGYYRVLDELLEGQRIGSSLIPVFITSFDLNLNRTVHFTSRDAVNPNKNPTFVDVCKATSAAPTYFPTYSFEYGREMLNCIDGGIVMNNPAMGALYEAISNPIFYQGDNNLSENISYDDICILSLGTGSISTSIRSHKLRNSGIRGWIKPIIDISTSAPSQIVDTQLESLYNVAYTRDNYLRFNVPLDEGKSNMDDSRKFIVDYWTEESINYIQSNDAFRTKLKLFLRRCGHDSQQTDRSNHTKDILKVSRIVIIDISTK